MANTNLGTALIERAIVANGLDGLTPDALPAVSAATTYRIAIDPADSLAKISVNGGAYSAIATVAGTTLQAAYDGGSTILLASGTGIAVTKTDVTNQSMLTLAVSPTGAATGAGLEVTMNSNATGGALTVSLNGVGRALLISDLVDGVTASPLVDILCVNTTRTGALLSVAQTAAGGASAGLAISMSDSSGSPLAVTWSGSIGATFTHSGADITTLRVTRTGVTQAAGHGLIVDYTGNGAGMNGDAMQVLVQGAGTMGRALVVTDGGTGANTADVVGITSTNAARRSSSGGWMLNITAADSQLIRATMTPAAASGATMLDFSCVDPNQRFSGTMAQFAVTDAASGSTTVLISETMTTVENLNGNLLLVSGHLSTARGTTATANAGVAVVRTQGNKPAAGAGANPYSNAPLVLNNTTAGQQSWLVLKDTANVFWRLYVSPAGVVTTELC